ncbi:MAG: GTP--adenosylcobinamide-phosphate guanylyltransferase [Altererythrobacter sp.]|nr:GTP--adenosylcobinamide-phosphate guanylyltransferase [Altererythrobacter sp.]MBK61841.1 GTP--adenosylcobinamide-phosphate guanylyltransferase [Altererythrobacter sp.]|tara:strand:+ start:67 stop:819 length:753 start_codon:yes stop_codon:yes gene_type:complete
MTAAALVLAGTRPGGDPFAEGLGVPHKALIELEGEPLLNRVISALRGAGIQRIAVSCDKGPVADLAIALGAEVLAPGRGPSASVGLALDALGTPLLVTTSDHALLEAGWVRELIEGTRSDADVSVMLARRDAIERAMEGTKRTYLRFADGQWSGCNLFYLQSPDAAKAIETWAMVEADRKRPWKIAARLGPATLFSMLLGRLSLQEGLERLGRRIGISAQLVAASDGLAAVDVDKQADLDAVRELLTRKR